MRIRVFGSPWRHRLDVGATSMLGDPRLAMTVCGIRFAWGYLPPAGYQLPICAVCGS